MEYKDYHSKTINGVDRWILGKRDRQTLRLMRKHFPLSSVLEIGPGRGTFGELCKQNTIDYDCVEDSTQGSINLGEKGLSVIRGRFPNLNILKKYDAVVARAVIEHCNDAQEACDFVRRAHEVLMPGGILWLEAPDIRFWKFEFWACDFSHNYICNVLRLYSLCKECGFEVEYSTTRSQFLLFPFDRFAWLGLKFIDKFLNWPFALLPDWKCVVKYRKLMYKFKLSSIPCAVLVCKKK